MTEVDSEEDFFFFSFIGKNLKKNDLKCLPQSLYLNPDHILLYMTWKKSITSKWNKVKEFALN